MLAAIREDIRAVLERDPAASNWLQVALFYPGVHAIWLHRLARWFWRQRIKIAGYAVASFARWLTGIEIHPAAQLGPRLFIDHGMGVVIGETAQVGANVTMYHGVTLGGVSLSHGKRHPTIEDGVVIGAGAKVLGAITIGRGSRVGANAVVVRDVAPNTVVVGIPAKVVPRKDRPLQVDLQHDQLPDILSERVDLLLRRLERVESWVRDEEAALQEEPDYSI